MKNRQIFAEKTVFVSGAARGIGRRVAQSFFEQGANLVLSDYDDELLDNAMAPYLHAGGRVVGISGDIGDMQTSADATKLALDVFGGLDIAINNAGIVQPQMRLDKIEVELAQKIIQVNLMGVFFAMKNQLPAMVKRAGESGEQCNIVNLGSAAGLMGSPLLSAYSAAKHGIIGFTRTAAIEYARQGIRINAVCPSFTDTDMAKNAIKQSRHDIEEAKRRMVAGVPLQRLARIDEVVQAILWVCSAKNSFYTGQALSIDGGLTTF